MIQLHLGDCIQVLRQLPDASVDSVVTDPPYELGFMGKAWDASGIANNVDLWREALRVLKPGGHLLAFSGSRTYHRMTCAIEDAGFEVRDQIMWLYGSGFPKSLDVSKAVDKQDATDLRRSRQLRFTEWVRGTGLSASRINEITESTMGSHYTTAAQQPAVATRGHLEKLRPFVGQSVPAWVEAMVDERTVESENFKRREVVGAVKMRDTSEVRIASAESAAGYDGAAKRLVNITTASTDAARQWEGWGTALKPAHEPICVARKPLAGTVAANVLLHGTGAINIAGCRVLDGSETGREKPVYLANNKNAVYAAGGGEWENTTGRWPANIIHDGSDEVATAFPEAGSAARFFYCAKASKADRDEGLEHFKAGPRHEVRPHLDAGRQSLPRANIHPTVKPNALMAYLCRLVTPPGGVVLDPFMGSGSTGKAAVREGFRFIGVDMTAEYVAIARARIEYALVASCADIL